LGWEELPDAPAAPVANGVETSRWLVDEGVRWRWPSCDSPSFRVLVANASLFRDRAHSDSLGAA